MNKPLSEWTLGEISVECMVHGEGCKNDGVCPFLKPDEEGTCRIRNLISRFPDSWDLSEPPRWTEQDRMDAHTIKAILLEASRVTIFRLPSGAVKLSESSRCVFLDLNCNLFPSLKPGESAMLDEIIGGGE